MHVKRTENSTSIPSLLFSLSSSSAATRSFRYTSATSWNSDSVSCAGPASVRSVFGGNGSELSGCRPFRAECEVVKDALVYRIGDGDDDDDKVGYRGWTEGEKVVDEGVPARGSGRRVVRKHREGTRTAVAAVCRGSVVVVRDERASTMRAWAAFMVAVAVGLGEV